MIFYHINRNLLHRFADGEILDFKKTLSTQYNFCHNIFTHHSERYLLGDCILHKNGIISVPGSFFWEIALEFIRAKNFPNKISRFECIYACQSYEFALIWGCNMTALSGHKNMGFTISTVESDRYEIYDSSWISGVAANDDANKEGLTPKQFALYCERAQRYWSGELTSSPMLEVLIPLPCRVVEAIYSPTQHSQETD